MIASPQDRRSSLVRLTIVVIERASQGIPRAAIDLGEVRSEIRDFPRCQPAHVLTTVNPPNACLQGLRIGSRPGDIGNLHPGCDRDQRYWVDESGLQVGVYFSECGAAGLMVIRVWAGETIKLYYTLASSIYRLGIPRPRPLNAR